MNGFPPQYAFEMATEYKFASSIIINEIKSGEMGSPMKFNFSSNKYEDVKQPK